MLFFQCSVLMFLNCCFFVSLHLLSFVSSFSLLSLFSLFFSFQLSCIYVSLWFRFVFLTSLSSLVCFSFLTLVTLPLLSCCFDFFLLGHCCSFALQKTQASPKNLAFLQKWRVLGSSLGCSGIEKLKTIIRRREGWGGQASPPQHRREHWKTKSVSKDPSLLSLFFAFVSRIMLCCYFSLHCSFSTNHCWLFLLIPLKTQVVNFCKFVFQWLFFCERQIINHHFGGKAHLFLQLEHQVDGALFKSGELWSTRIAQGRS